MIGAGHPTLADTLNRLSMIEHKSDGSHGSIHADSIIATALSVTTLNVLGSAVIALADNSVAPSKLVRDATVPTSALFYRGDGVWSTPAAPTPAIRRISKAYLSGPITIQVGTTTFYDLLSMSFTKESATSKILLIGLSTIFVDVGGNAAAPVSLKLFETVTGNIDESLKTVDVAHYSFSGAAVYVTNNSPTLLALLTGLIAGSTTVALKGNYVSGGSAVPVAKNLQLFAVEIEANGP